MCATCSWPRTQTLPLLEISERQKQRYQEQATKCPTKFLYRALQIMNRCDVEYRQSSNKRLLVELTLIEVAQITQPDDDVPAAGRSPRRLKSLFKFLVSTTQSKPAQQVAGTEKSLSLRAAQRQHTEKTVADTPKVTVTTNTVAGPSPSGQRQQTVSGTMAGGGNATKPKFNF